MERINIFSSGGVGDALIVGLKISKIEYHKRMVENKVPVIYWYHYERHECHRWAINEIMKQFVQPQLYHCHISKTAELSAKEECKKIGGTYLNTKIMGVVSPYIASKIGNRFIMPYFSKEDNRENNKAHVVVNVVAGRLSDDTKRIISSNVIEQIANRFIDRKIILIGPELSPEYNDIEKKYNGRIVNLTGFTETIIDALSYINECCLFIGQDGVMAYYAMMLRKPTIIHYHIPDLIAHYFNAEWAYHSIALFGGGNELDNIDVNNNEISALFDIAEAYNE